MQSLSSKIRLVGKHDKLFLARNHFSRQPLLMSNRRDTNTKHFFVRQFSEKGSIASPAKNRFSPFYSFFGWYSKKLDTHPISTKCVSAALVSSMGSVLAQYIAHRQNEKEDSNDKNKNDLSKQKPFEIDYERVSCFVFLNIVFVAPVLHHWYEFVNRALPGRSFSRVLQRTFCDEFLFSPIYIPVLLGMLWKLEGSTNNKIYSMLKAELPTIIVTEWAMWVPTMIVTFRYVPVKFQVLVVNVVGVVWNTYLAYAANNAHSSSPESEGKEKDKASGVDSEST